MGAGLVLKPSWGARGEWPLPLSSVAETGGPASSRCRNRVLHCSEGPHEAAPEGPKCPLRGKRALALGAFAAFLLPLAAGRVAQARRAGTTFSRVTTGAGRWPRVRSVEECALFSSHQGISPVRLQDPVSPAVEQRSGTVLRVSGAALQMIEVRASRRVGVRLCGLVR